MLFSLVPFNKSRIDQSINIFKKPTADALALRHAAGRFRFFWRANINHEIHLHVCINRIALSKKMQK